MADNARVLHESDGETIVLTDHLRLRLEGAFATFFYDRLLPLLDGTRSAEEIERALSDVDTDTLHNWLRRLVGAGALSDGPQAGFVAALRLGEAANEHLCRVSVAIVGTDQTSLFAAKQFAELGVGSVRLIAVRSDVTAAQIPEGVALAGYASSRETLAPLLEGCDIVTHLIGRGHLASAHWTNQLTVTTGQRALYATVNSARAVVGPLVLPGEGPCYLCYRMRELANSDDYDVAMADERATNTAIAADLVARAAWEPLAPIAASVVVMEAAKTLLGFGAVSLAAQVWDLDALTMTATHRRVLERPDCPVCRKKGHPPPPIPTLAALRGAVDFTGDPLVVKADLVDERCGIVRSLTIVPRDITEPPLPLVVRAEVSNHRFVSAEDEPFGVASGKGMSMEEAERSALGEAVERYGAAPWNPAMLIRCSASELDMPFVAPTALMRYAGAQLDKLGFKAWSARLVMDWVPARRLNDGATVLVPALGTFMDYSVPTHEEFFYQVTSNGLAAGATLIGAVLAGLAELIERDAFMISWLARSCGTAIDPCSVADADVRRITEAYRRRGIELRVVLLPIDQPLQVCLAIGVDHRACSDRPAAVVGLGADANPNSAIRKAAMEVAQVRPALRARMRDPEVQARLSTLLDDPSQVAELDDHDLLYAHSSQLRHLEHWLSEKPVELTSPAPKDEQKLDAGQLLDQIVHRLDQLGVPVCWVNLTPPDIASLGLSVVRVHAPGLQPITFGAHNLPIGERAAAAADRNGTTPNRYPHPLA